MKLLRSVLLASCLGLSISVLAAPAFNIRLPGMGEENSVPPGVELSWSELRTASAKGNDNETNCTRYDDNDNFEAGENLIMNLLRKFCIHDRDAREVEESAGGQTEGRADPFPGASVQAVTLTRATAQAGKETAVAQKGDRVVLRVFSSLNRDLGLAIRNIDPSTLPDTPGPALSGFAFALEADDRGSAVATLNAEARLSAVYTDTDLAKLDEQKLAVAWLDPATNRWADAPKQATDPKSNYISATITNMGTYTIYQRG